MYKISEFSKITGLTVKALRYYDEQCLLTPSYRCSETSYRFYDDGDFHRAMLIKLLRTLDFSISEIRDVLLNYESEDDLYFYLREKQNLIRQSILSETEKLEKIESFLYPAKHSETCFQYDIALKEIKAVNVIALRFTGKYSDLDKYVPLLYQIAKNDCNGNYFNCYYSELSADPAHLGVKAGYICILHSWGSEMNFHPHLHTILLGGGLTSQNKWKDNGNDLKDWVSRNACRH